MMRSRVVNAIGAGFTGSVLVIVLLTKFTHGAYIVVIAMPILFLLMKGINKHYRSVSVELELARRPRLHGAAHAGARRRTRLEDPRPDAARARLCQGHPPAHARGDHRRRRQGRGDGAERGVGARAGSRQGAAAGAQLALPRHHRAGARPRRRASGEKSPRDLVVVYIPEYVVGHWWEQLLHNQTPLRIKARLLYQPGVMVTSVPFQLRSSSSGCTPTTRSAPMPMRGPRPRQGAGTAEPAARRLGRAPRDRTRMTAPSCRGRASVGPPAAPRPDRRDPLVGSTVELEIGTVGMGGVCIARLDGRVVFVRHALPGERVHRPDHRRLRRVAAARRRGRRSSRRRRTGSPPPVPARRAVALRRLRLAARGRCRPSGRLKASIVREQLARLAGLDLPVVVERRARSPESTTGSTGARACSSMSRRRASSASTGTARTTSRSSRRARLPRRPSRRWGPRGPPGPAPPRWRSSARHRGDRALIVTPGHGDVSVPQLPGEASVLRGKRTGPAEALMGRPGVREEAIGRTWRVSGSGFWQVHPEAPELLAGAVLVGVVRWSRARARSTSIAASGSSPPRWPRPVGASGRVTAVESDVAAATDAIFNLSDLPSVEVLAGSRRGRPALDRVAPCRPRRTRPASQWCRRGRHALDCLARSAAHRLCRVRPGVARARPQDLRRTRLFRDLAARLRSVPDDPARGVPGRIGAVRVRHGMKR